MKKINTKNILKKIFKSKKSKKKEKNKIKKLLSKKNLKTKKKKIKEKKIKKTNNLKVKDSSNKKDTKVENLRIIKNNEQKPEIKKVKIQSTEKREYKIKDFVVYPKHGVGQIIEFKKVNIGGIEVETYVLKFEKDKANGMVPVNKQSHLRPLATINQINKCVSI